MVKLFSEFITNIILLSVINNEAIIEIITEVQNILVVIAVRIVYGLCEKGYKNYRDGRKFKTNK